MNCARAQALIDAPGAADDAARAALTEHLAGCADCRALAASEARIRTALAAERHLQPSRELQAALLAVPRRGEQRARVLALAMLPLAALVCALGSASLWLALPRLPGGSTAGGPPASPAAMTHTTATTAGAPVAPAALADGRGRATATPSELGWPAPGATHLARVLPATPTATARRMADLGPTPPPWPDRPARRRTATPLPPGARSPEPPLPRGSLTPMPSATSYSGFVGSPSATPPPPTPTRDGGRGPIADTPTAPPPPPGITATPPLRDPPSATAPAATGTPAPITPPPVGSPPPPTATTPPGGQPSPPTGTPTPTATATATTTPTATDLRTSRVTIPATARR